MNCNLTESQKENRKAQTISGQKKKKKKIEFGKQPD